MHYSNKLTRELGRKCVGSGGGGIVCCGGPEVDADDGDLNISTILAS
jgi:hypothetical protein